MMTIASPILRLATIDDLESLLKIEEKSFSSDKFSPAQYRYLLTRANATPLVLTIAGSVAATAIMLWRTNSRQGHLYTIAVDPDFHGQGLGKLLLLACEAEARKRGCDRISLEVRQDNQGAIGLYQKHGFEVTAEMTDYYEDGTAAYKMVKAV